VGPALAAFAHLNGLQSGYVPPILPDDSPAGTPQPSYPQHSGPAQPAFQPYPSQQFPGQPHIAQPYVTPPAPQAYPPQRHRYAEQLPAVQQYPYGSPDSGQPHMTQPYSGQQVPGQPVHGQPPAYGHPARQPYQPQPYAPAPGHMPPHGTAQPYGAPTPHYADPAQSLQVQQYGYQPHPGYATQPGYPMHAPQPEQPTPYPVAPQQAQAAVHYVDPQRAVSAASRLTERIAVQPPFTPGYSEQSPKALLRSADDLGEKRAWHVSDDAPRYLPPGTSEADLDPFGLAALPEQAAYHGPKEVPSEAVYGLLFGLCSLLLFPLALLGFARARRAGSMIDAAPSRFRGRLVVLLGFALNVVCPILSVAAGAYLFGFI
jgi:hypothetical protein